MDGWMLVSLLVKLVCVLIEELVGWLRSSLVGLVDWELGIGWKSESERGCRDSWMTPAPRVTPWLLAQPGFHRSSWFVPQQSYQESGWVNGGREGGKGENKRDCLDRWMAPRCLPEWRIGPPPLPPWVLVQLRSTL